MKHSKKYKKMMKAHKKIIRKDAKIASTAPFDYAYGLNMLVDHLRFMRDYYEVGEVVGGDQEGYPSRLQLLNMIIVAFEDWYEKDVEDAKDYNYKRKRFFELLGEYIEELWD